MKVRDFMKCTVAEIGKAAILVEPTTLLATPENTMKLMEFCEENNMSIAEICCAFINLIAAIGCEFPKQIRRVQ